jgi:molybdate/tungstate transport system permease protein
MTSLKTPALLVMALVPLLYILVPLLHLFHGVSWTTIRALGTDDEFVQALGTSVAAACITTLASVVFGLPSAFVLSTFRFRGKRIIEGFLLLPLVLPPIVGGTAQLSLYGPTSAVGGWFLSHGIHLTDSLVGIVIAQTFVTSPFLILAAKSGFDAVPMELWEVTKLSGGSLWTQFVRVSIPLSRMAIFAGLALTFARAMGEFGATMMVAYHPYTLPVDIWVQFSSNGLSGVTPIAVALCVLTVLVIGSSSLLKKS